MPSRSARITSRRSRPKFNRSKMRWEGIRGSRETHKKTFRDSRVSLRISKPIKKRLRIESTISHLNSKSFLRVISSLKS
jgi:hypothetical protein